MRMRQHVYFAIRSATLTALDMTRTLGIEPDETVERGSRRSSPNPVPVCHGWKIRCANTTQRLDDQASEVLDRIRPAAAMIRQLVDEGRVEASLVFVRHFNDDHGVEEDLSPITADGLVLDRVPGQHQLLGWMLGPEELNLLASMRASIDADEYG